MIKRNSLTNDMETMNLTFEIPEKHINVISVALTKLPIEVAGETWDYMRQEYERALERRRDAEAARQKAEIEAAVQDALAKKTDAR